MPRLWDDTIDAHRHEVRGAILQAAADLVAERGVRATTMSELAERAGIGRATLYRYFSDVDAILLAWHERQIASHLGHLAAVRDQVSGAAARLHAVLEAFALISRESRAQHDRDVAAVLHRDPQVLDAEQELLAMVRELIAEAAMAGEIRDDVPPEELAHYCVHALAAAASLPSDAAVRRLVAITFAGLSRSERVAGRERPDASVPQLASAKRFGSARKRSRQPGEQK